MRPTIRRTAALGLLILLTACSGNAAQPAPTTPPAPVPAPATTRPPEVDLSAFREGEIPADLPKPDLSRLPPKPADSAPLRARIAWEALEKVATFADAIDPGARAACPDFDPSTDKSATCTVTFLGDTYAYVLSNISFEDSMLADSVTGAREPGLVKYNAELTAGPIVREFQESVLRLRARTRYVRCDMPDHVRFEFAGAIRQPDGLGGSILRTGIECQALDPATGRVTSYDLESHEGRWGGQFVVLSERPDR